MDCLEPVDDYCDVWQAEYLQIPEDIPSSTDNLVDDQFFIVLEVKKTIPLISNDDDEEEKDDDEFVQAESTCSLTFWEPCPRLDKNNLSKERISGMLSKAGVPLHKQEYMVDRISERADEIANEKCNKSSRVLPIVVSISVVACLCMSRDYHDQEKEIN